MRPHTHDSGSAPHNTISFNLQGCLLFLAGFSNLARKINPFYRHRLNKICTIDAPNATYCSWSPDRCLLLTATLSPHSASAATLSERPRYCIHLQARGCQTCGCPLPLSCMWTHHSSDFQARRQGWGCDNTSPSGVSAPSTR